MASNGGSRIGTPIERKWSHTYEGLIATEMDNPLRTAASVEAAGLVEVVYPGIEKLSMPPAFESELSANDATREALSSAWPHFLCGAARYCTCRPGRRLVRSFGKSNLGGRLASSRPVDHKDTKTAGLRDASLGMEDRTPLQMRVWFARMVLQESGVPEPLALKACGKGSRDGV